MKKIIFGFILSVALFTISYGSNGNTNPVLANIISKEMSFVIGQQVKGDTTPAFPANEIISGYLQIKNALINENGKDAATAGRAIVTALAKADTKNLSDAQKKVYLDIAEDLKENAEHIGANQDKIAHQREHFVLLSNLMPDFIKVFGNGGQTLYKDFCPMANDGKGAIWFSEIKEIKNPYYGKRMLTCGSVKATIQ